MLLLLAIKGPLRVQWAFFTEFQGLLHHQPAGGGAAGLHPHGVEAGREADEVQFGLGVGSGRLDMQSAAQGIEDGEGDRAGQRGQVQGGMAVGGIGRNTDACSRL